MCAFLFAAFQQSNEKMYTKDQRRDLDIYIPVDIVVAISNNLWNKKNNSTTVPCYEIKAHWTRVCLPFK